MAQTDGFVQHIRFRQSMVIVMRKESYSMKCHADSSPASNDPENDKCFEDCLEVEYDKGFWSEVS